MSDAIWFYVDRNRQRVGPVAAAAIAEAYRLGQVDAQSLVWREGMAEWVALAQHFDELGIVGPPPLSMRLPAPSSPHMPPAPLPGSPGASPKSSAGPWLIGCGVIGFLFIIVVPILAAIALPAYQDYVIRSQITATLADIRGYVTAAEEIHFRSGACPAGNEDVGAPGEVTHAGNGMTLVAVGEDHLGRCVIAGTRVGGNPRADGTTVSLTRQESGEWRCTVDNDLQPKYLPTGCEPE